MHYGKSRVGGFPGLRGEQLGSQAKHLGCSAAAIRQAFRPYSSPQLPTARLLLKPCLTSHSLTLTGGLASDRFKKRADAKSSKGSCSTWEGSFVKPTTLKFNDPSSEIEASERMAREGRIEEETEVKTGPLAV
ncbi:hypothetical protein FRB90_008662 [Tulasnella sp. 427]|nr:hypothetical protein FRB90_008662 [Tulasnella sp. 427]